MATPTTLMLGTSEKVYFIRDDEEAGGDQVEGLGEECALTVTYQLAEGESLETVAKEKAAEIGALHAEAQKAIRLARAERKSGRIAGPRAETEHAKEATEEKPPAKFIESTPPFHANGNGGPPITGPQRLAIEEHFRRLGYTAQDILAHINGRFAKSRLTDLTVRQASDLLSELQRMSVEPRRNDEPNEPVHVPVNGRRNAKRK